MTPLMTGATVGPENYQAWLDTRRSGIGASEIAAVLGICPYTTPRELYLRKVGLLPDLEETEGMRRGKHMEAFLAAEYRRQFPEADIVEQTFCRDPDHPHLFATLDAVHRDGGTIVEFKTASSRQAAQWGEDGSDKVPFNYLCQVQHQMLVSGASLAHVFASIAGDDCRLFVVPRNEVVINHILDDADEFWQRVVLRDPPPASRPDDSRWNPYIYPEPAGAIDMGDEADDLIGEWISAKQVRAEADDRADRCKAELLELLGAAEAGRLRDGRTLTRKIVTRAGGTYTRKDSTFTDLRIKEARRRDG